MLLRRISRFTKKQAVTCPNDTESNLLSSRAVDSFWDAMWLELWSLRFVGTSRRIVFWHTQMIQNQICDRSAAVFAPSIWHRFRWALFSSAMMAISQLHTYLVFGEVGPLEIRLWANDRTQQRKKSSPDEREQWRGAGGDHAQVRMASSSRRNGRNWGMGGSTCPTCAA